MKRLLILLVGLLVVPWFFPRFRAYWRCTLRNRHNPVRHPLGGFICADCDTALLDLAEAGLGDGYVPIHRRLFDRRHSTVTRTTSWEPEPDRSNFYRPGVRRRADRALPGRAS